MVIRTKLSMCKHAELNWCKVTLQGQMRGAQVLGPLVDPINAAPNITHCAYLADGCLQSACCCTCAQEHQLQGILEDCAAQPAVALVLQSSTADSRPYSQHMSTPQTGRQGP